MGAQGELLGGETWDEVGLTGIAGWSNWKSPWCTWNSQTLCGQSSRWGGIVHIGFQTQEGALQL